ncbi:MAG: hypothetical protein U1B83_02770 [Candidatus Cloacimonadaceae bacterium]|nr:hypothetical protein [Candidatus Cloacimonadaceae bacterium]
MSMYLINIAVFWLLMGGVFMYVIKTPVRFKKAEKWKHLSLPLSIPFTELEEKVRAMVQTGMLCSAGNDKGLLYFKEKPDLFSWGNSYVLRQDDEQHFTLFYRGTLIKWRVDKTNLSNIVFILGARVAGNL